MKLKIVPYFIKKRKFNSYSWMDVVIITKVAQSAQHLLPHMREDANAACQLHCQWRCHPADAKHAAKRCYHFLCLLTIWTPFINRQNNKDGKVKVCSWLFSSDNYGNLTGLCGIFGLHFPPDLRQIWTFTFTKSTNLPLALEWDNGS